MPILLQIDSCLGVLSTGRITESIANIAISRGWNCYIFHGARCVGDSIQKHYQVSSLFEEYCHYAESLLFDRHGLGSRKGTIKIIEKIKEINPDVIHLHCIHGYYINYKYLFEYLNTLNIPVVWTFHDCWAFTGHCAYFDKINCKKWISHCTRCELVKEYPKSFVDNSYQNFELKKFLFSKVKKLTIVPVSIWLEGLTKKSFFKNRSIVTIHNGTDLNAFKPYSHSELCDKYNISDFDIILGVSAVWDERKGMCDFIKLSRLLPENYRIVLIGVSKKQMKCLPTNIIGIGRTDNVKQLAELYSQAAVFVNPTYSDNFPTTNIEALACGTPVVTYNTGGSPEAIDKETGYVVNKGDIYGLLEAINKIKDMVDVGRKCRKRAELLFNRDDCFAEYINLYETLIRK